MSASLPETLGIAINAILLATAPENINNASTIVNNHLQTLAPQSGHRNGISASRRDFWDAESLKPCDEDAISSFLLQKFAETSNQACT